MANTEENFDKIMEEMESQEKVSTPDGAEAKAVSKEESTEITFPHEKIMKEEGLSQDDLPDDIRKMVITFNRKLRMAYAKKASEATMLKIQNLSTLIADKIIDHLESDIPETHSEMEDGGVFEEGGVDDPDDPIDEEPETKEKGGIFLTSFIDSPTDFNNSILFSKFY